MSYEPKFCECCGEEIADWNRSGYCSRTARCRRARLRAVQGIPPEKYRPTADDQLKQYPHTRTCLECGGPVRRGAGTYCNRNPVCKSKYQAEQRLRYKLECFDAYGGRQCACCGETRVYFLTLDHVFGDGNEDRRQHHRGNGVYSQLRTAGFPDKDKYQVLCFNCNAAKGSASICPCSLERAFE